MISAKVLICGDRNWTDKAMIEYYLTKTLPKMGLKPVLIIEGGARGADRLAAQVAIELGIPIQEHPAHWNIYGRGAGPIRNKEMLQEHPDVVVTFHDNLEQSKGTKNMVKQARDDDQAIIVLVKHEGK